MNKIIMYSHGGSGNRGCEAIVRSTQKILQLYCQDNDLRLATLNRNEDIECRLSGFKEIIEYSNYTKRNSIDHIKAAISYRITNNSNKYISLAQKNLYKQFNRDTIALSIGGDNYCYTDSKWLYISNREAKERKAKTVLWGCSIEEENIDAEMLRDLLSYDLIVARETITYDTLIKKGVSKNTKLYPDPAFQLDYYNSSNHGEIVEENTIGINLSPYIYKSKLDNKKVINIYIELVNYILKNTDMNIKLIPHVYWENNNDLDILKLVYKNFNSDSRVSIITKRYNCMQLKNIISKCRMFIGARTHSTIAAYSTCVPTLVLGYSVKSRGIARDIFGSEEDMVVNVQQIYDKDYLIGYFDKFIKNEDKIRKTLKFKMPKYMESSKLAGQEIRNLMKESEE